MITARRLKNALKAYNSLMDELGLEFLTVGEWYSEEKEEKAKWNLRDMVSEAQYQLDMYSEEGTVQYEELHAADENDVEWVTVWRAPGYDERKAKERREKEKARNKEIANGAKEKVKALKGFINLYKNDASGMKCYTKHSSKWD